MFQISTDIELIWEIIILKHGKSELALPWSISAFASATFSQPSFVLYFM